MKSSLKTIIAYLAILTMNAYGQSGKDGEVMHDSKQNDINKAFDVVNIQFEERKKDYEKSLNGEVDPQGRELRGYYGHHRYGHF